MSVSLSEKLGASKNARKSVSNALEVVLGSFMISHEPISEVTMRDAWLVEIRKNPYVFPDGWYIPPPHGIGVLFATEESPKRINYNHLRRDGNWPQENILLDRKIGIFYVYSSPVDRKTGIIGDFGATIYFGRDERVKDHLKQCIDVNRAIFDHIQVGMPFLDIYNFAIQKMQEQGLTNNVISTTDSTGVDIGHTVPMTNQNWSPAEYTMIQDAKDWSSICGLISKKRKFVNAEEPLKVQPGIAITLEPRMTVIDKPDIPMVSYHMICVVHEDGSKELLENFENLFRLTNMNYMLKN